jgi:V/A-type H+-transporting ATPase subunit E
MVHTVQSFVDTLRADGVEAGRKAAEEIRREANEQAEQTIRKAEAEARQIIEKAEQQRENTLERTRVDLELAARDTLAKLRDALTEAVDRVLAKAVSETLGDVDFLKSLIREITCTYAKSDALGDETIDLNVSEPMRQKLTDWVIATFHKSGGEDGVSLELHGSLLNAGFECKVARGTVEITPESVVQVLSSIVTPQLRDLIMASQERRSKEGT